MEEVSGSRRGGRSIASSFGIRTRHEALREEPDSSLQVSAEASISFLQYAASLPRWILNAKTAFSSFLAKSFHIHRCGTCPSSVVFPLPLPECGLFDGSGPKLSRKKWTSLVKRRLLHVVVVALNFLYSGYQSDLKLLGRCPNLAQKSIHSRLRALVTTCGQSGEFPLPPGRSGFEFIARLTELDRYASSKLHTQSDVYAEDPVDLRPEKVGAISSHEKFVPPAPHSGSGC